MANNIYKRQANGAGTVTKLKGNRRRPWRALTPAIEGPDGFVRQTIGYYETRQEALDALTLYRQNPIADRLTCTLEELHAEWEPVAYRNLSKSTKSCYNAAWSHYNKKIRAQKVKDIRSGHLQAVIDAAAAEGLSRSSLEKIKVLAVMMEDYAVQNDIIQKNYAAFLKLPKEEKTEKSIFTDIDLKKLEEGEKAGIGVAELILVMCYTGWRIQEFCLLTRFSYDEKEKTLTGGLKTDAGRDRVVPIPTKVQHIVDRYAALNGSALFCWTDEKGKLRAYDVKRLRTEFYATLKALGIKAAEGEKKLTPHSTRHTYNSMLNKAGVDLTTRMKLMGQVSEATNLEKYTHADREMMKAAVAAIG